MVFQPFHEIGVTTEGTSFPPAFRSHKDGVRHSAPHALGRPGFGPQPMAGLGVPPGCSSLWR